jgi:VWA-like domain (DUF2201)
MRLVAAAIAVTVVVHVVAAARQPFDRLGAVPGAIEGQQPTFRSTVDVVRIPAVVTENGRAVNGLTAGDFELLDANVKQTIDVTPVEGQPVDVTLVLDTSASVSGPALDALRADVQTIAEGLQPNDRVRLITFGGQVHDVFGLQPGGAALPVDRIHGGGVTSLYAALGSALMIDPGIDRPELVFALTDGLDTASFFDAKRLVTIAGSTTASLYVALVKSTDTVLRTSESGEALAGEHTTVEYAPSRRAVLEGQTVTRTFGSYVGGPNVASLKAAVARTGGALYQNASGTLVSRFQSALAEFRSGYVLSYRPAGSPRPGWHDIVVHTTNRRYTVRARGGYDGAS